MKLPIRVINPQPMAMEEREGAFLFGTELTMQTAPGALTADMKDEVCGLWNRFTMTLGRLEIAENSVLSGGQALVGACAMPPLNGEDEYALRIGETGAAINARDAKGILHALFTLLQVIEPLSKAQFALPCLEIHDHPAMKARMLHLCVFPETTLLLLEKAIRLAGALKYSHVILEFWGMYRYRCLPALSWPDISFTDEQLRPLIRLIRALGMEPVPMVNHLGHATQSRGCFGRHVVLDQDPTQAMLFEPDGWTWCLSNPDAMNLLRAMRGELMELFGEGDYFHLGCDESYSFATCPRCREHDQGELLAGYLNDIAQELAAQGRRPIIWADQLLDAARWTNEGVLANQRPDQTTHQALPLLDRRIIMADWQYFIVKSDMPTSRFLKEEGFEVMLCPWDQKANIDALGRAAIEQGQLGLIATTWDHLPNYLPQASWAADWAWCGRAENRANYRLEMGALLRRLMPYPHSYEAAGFNTWEVQEFARGLAGR